MTNPLAVVCLSGGMDSCVTAAIAAETHELALLHANYGQRTEARELWSFREIAEFYKVEKRLVVDLEHLERIGGSALTDQAIEVPTGTVPPTNDMTGQSRTAGQSLHIPVTYVPFRNANILAAAVAWAEVIGAHAVFIGAVEEDSSGYPDCRESFFRAFQEAVTLGTRPESKIEIVTPVIHMKKAEIVRRGAALGAPFQLTWSCYRHEKLACGECDSCLLRMRAFKEAGVPDPIPYAKGSHP
jgi:7-cyano-7-deazaguanine synthase